MGGSAQYKNIEKKFILLTKTKGKYITEIWLCQIFYIKK